jgi:hypothetical protein
MANAEGREKGGCSLDRGNTRGWGGFAKWAGIKEIFKNKSERERLFSKLNIKLHLTIGGGGGGEEE